MFNRLIILPFLAYSHQNYSRVKYDPGMQANQPGGINTNMNAMNTALIAGTWFQDNFPRAVVNKKQSRASEEIYYRTNKVI